MQQMKAQPNMPREAIAEMNKILIQDCREYMKKTRMPPSGDSAFKAGLVGDLMSFAMRENNQIAKELNLVPANDPRAVLDAKIRAQRERLERKEGYLERKQEAERQRFQKEKDIRTVIRNTKQLSKEYLNSLTQIGAFKRKNQKLKDILAEGAKLGDHTSAREIGDYLKRFNNMVKGEDYPTLTRFGSMAEKSLKALVTDKADLDIGIGARIETREGELAYLESRQQALAGPQNQPVNAAQQPVGTRMELHGRLQSREYLKVFEDRSEQRVTYELSVTDAYLLPQEY